MKNYLKKYIPYLFLLCVMCYLLFLIYPAVVGQLGGTFRSVPIPQEYLQLKEFIASQKDFSRTLWVPSSQRFVFTSSTHPAVSAQDLFHTTSIHSTIGELQKPGTEQSLQYAGIKYVVVPDDTEKELFITDRKYDPKLYRQTIAGVSGIPWLTKIDNFGHLAVYQVPQPKDHFFILQPATSNTRLHNNAVQIVNINPTTYRISVSEVKKGDQLLFSDTYDNNWELISLSGSHIASTPYEKLFNSFLLPQSGTYAVTISYRPQKLVTIGLIISALSTVLCLMLLGVLNISLKKKEEITRRKLFSELDEEIWPAYYTQFGVAKSYIQDKVVLDVGCWSGQLAQLLVTSAKKVKGIDPGKEAIALAKRKVPQGDFVVGRAEKLPYRSNSCDVVIFFEVIEHVPKGNELRALKEMYRVLKPGGYLLMSTPHKNFVSILLDPAFFLLGHRHYSFEELKLLLEDAGFNIEKTFRKFGFYSNISMYVVLLAKHILRKKITFPSYVKKKLIEEGEKEGFLGIYVIAKK